MALFVLSALGVGGCYESHYPAGTDAAPNDANDGPDMTRAPDIGLPDIGLPDIGLPDMAVETDSGPITPPRVEQLCIDAPQQPFAFTGGFPPLRAGCPWGEADNLGPVDAVAAARSVEEYALDIEQGSVLCHLEIQVGGPSSQLLYDDNFVLVLGNVVLAASDRGMVDNLETEGRLRLWEWSRVVGRPMAVADNTPYCAGEAEGLSDCEIPASEERGRASIRFSDAFVAEVAAVLAAGPPFVLKLITIGDDNEDTDCSHDAIEFRITGAGVAP